MKICAITILYNAEKLVADYIESYIHHVEKVIVIDNSETYNREIEDSIRKKIPENKISFIRNNKNLGVAFALNQGFLIAEQEKFSWVLTMDQDSYFDKQDFFNFSAPLLGREDIGIIAASYQHKMPFQKYYSNDFNQYLFVVTSGNLVNVKAWKKVGGFDERIFIDEVDNDFCIRLAINKYHTIGSTDILLKHYLGEPFSVRIPLKKKRIPIGIHNALRVRYTVRNRLFVSRKYLFRYPEFSLNRTYHNLLLLTFILFFYPQKIKYLHAYGKGITDFLFSRYGKIEQ